MINLSGTESVKDLQSEPVNFSSVMLIDTILKNSQDLIFVKDLHSNFVLNSTAHARLFNLEHPQEMVGKSDFDFFPKDFAQIAFDFEQEIIRTGVPLIGHIERAVSKTGEVSWFSSSKYPLFDEFNRIIGTWGTSRDITKLKQAEVDLARANKELEKINRLDELSGLYNRRHFYEVLNKYIKKHEDRLSLGLKDSFCLVALDIDNFKSINDTFGHSDGDEAIRHIGKLLTDNCRSDDSIYRIGGDEYVILLTDTNLTDAIEQSERLRKVIESTPLLLHGRSCKLTVSMGVSSYEDNNDLNDFVREADSRLYNSKMNGRNRVT